MRKMVYDVYVPSEYSAGIRGFTDTVTVIIESGDPGGEKDGEYSFVEEMRKFLNEWYDGGKVEVLSDTVTD
ncbi:hypothetical protein [Neomegalonema sp.]|uniref:hypothetical protein n=1 Tax=Neomegalonema sp. TaxID=2039713 RepID=UPI0026383AB7|nr:hypothetical protein [Neomegalonema sp.]MDD2869632.1 hypothetical protein [Neomegalonema sp.]